MIGDYLSKLREFFSPISVSHTPEGAVIAGMPPPTIAQQRAFLHRHTLSSILPYEAYDPEIQVFINTTLVEDKKTGKRHGDCYGFILECVPLAGANVDTARILSSIFEQRMPDNACIQFTMYASPKIQNYLTSWVDSRIARDDGDPIRQYFGHPSSDIYRTLAHRRVDHLLKGCDRSLFKEQPYVLRDFQLFISVSFPGELTDKGLSYLQSTREAIRAALSTSGVPNRNVDAAMLINLIDEILDPEQATGELVWDEERVLRTQMPSADTRLLLDRDGMTINNRAVRCLRVRSYPKSFWLGEMGNLIGDLYHGSLQIPSPFLLSLNVQVPDQEMFKRKLDFKAARAVTNAEGQLAKFVPVFKDQAEDWRHVQKAVASGQIALKMVHTMVLFTPLGEGDRVEQSVRSLFRTKGWIMECASMSELPTFLATLPYGFTPAMADDMLAELVLRTQLQSNALNTMPVIGEWKGTQNPLLLLFGRRGQVSYLDFFDNDQGNYNVAVSAKSGAGKSFFLNEVVVSTLGTGGRAWIIDVGRSYMHTTKILKGRFIEFSEDSNICINPFPLITDMDEEMPLIKSIIAQMASPSRPLNDLELSYIEQAVRAVWTKYGRDASITPIAEFLIAHRDERARDLGEMLYPYTRDGVYARYFEGTECLRFDNNLITLELEELKSRKDLQSVVLLIVMMQIQQAMYLGDRAQRKICVIDEAWDLFSNAGNAADFIETGYRRVRKYGGSFMTATQNIDDYYRTPAAKAALENSDWLCLLAQHPESIDRLADSGRLYLDDYKKRMLRSVHTLQGRYSEICIKGPMGMSIQRLIVDPFTATLYSTKAAEFKRLQELEASGLSTAEAIEWMIEEKARGTRIDPPGGRHAA